MIEHSLGGGEVEGCSEPYLALYYSIEILSKKMYMQMKKLNTCAKVYT